MNLETRHQQISMQFIFRSNTMIQDVNSAFSPDYGKTLPYLTVGVKLLLNWSQYLRRQFHLYTPPPSLVQNTNRPFGVWT